MTDGRDGSPPGEFHRDQSESMFTSTLRSLFWADPAIVAVVFVDTLGEAVDYCGSIDPMEAKIVGAHMQVVMKNLGPSFHKSMLGELGELHVHAEHYEFVVRRIDEEYSCIVMRREGGSDEVMLAALEITVNRLRGLAGLATPRWDQRSAGLQVTVRPSQGWGFAPETVGDAGEPMQVDAVLGRWEESGGLTGRPLVCFRVHTVDGRDSTLVFDEAHERWYRW